MRCPWCDGRGKLTRTSGPTGVRYTESGREHSHHAMQAFYRCKNGHAWYTSRPVRCLVPDCDWNEIPSAEESGIADRLRNFLRGIGNGSW